MAVILIIITVYLMTRSKEKFSSKREKAQKIFEWFSENKTPTYAEYRSDLNYKSNIVEYEDIKRLFGTKDFTLETVEATI